MWKTLSKNYLSPKSIASSKICKPEVASDNEQQAINDGLCDKKNCLIWQKLKKKMN